MAPRDKAAEHAGNFLFNREQAGREAGRRDGRPRPLIVAPYDAELFGHWWFEGPTVPRLPAPQDALRPADGRRRSRAPEYLDRHPTIAGGSRPSPSSWGDKGYCEVWLDGSNDWIYRHLHARRDAWWSWPGRFAAIATPLEQRALNQAARELLLAQSSDWAFIMKMQTATGYATQRVKAHVARFRRLVEELTAGRVDEAWLADLEARDNLFPHLDFRIYAG